jgi:hypothetical protein
MERGSLGLFLGLRTPQLPTAHAEAGTVLAHWTGHYTYDISRTSLDACHSSHAASCRTASVQQFLRGRSASSPPTNALAPPAQIHTSEPAGDPTQQLVEQLLPAGRISLYAMASGHRLIFGCVHNTGSSTVAALAAWRPPHPPLGFLSGCRAFRARRHAAGRAAKGQYAATSAAGAPRSRLAYWRR